MNLSFPPKAGIPTSCPLFCAVLQDLSIFSAFLLLCLQPQDASQSLSSSAVPPVPLVQHPPHSI
eukprot:2058423-Prorocentrum_lima.AAC.1